MSKTPKLRFKEFSGDWEENKLGELLIKSSETTNENTDIPVLTSSRKGLFLQSEYFKKEISAKDTTGYNILRRGYFTYRHMSDDSTFFFNINNILDLALVSPEYPVFTTNSNLNSYILQQHLNNSPLFYNFCKKQKKGGTRTRLYFSVLQEYKLALPSKAEQDKIASFLSLIDDKISLQSEKVDALKDYKKGIMQKIFSRELRFKDDEGRDYPDWEEKKLGKILKERSIYSEKNRLFEHVTLSKDGIQEKGERYDRDFLVTTDNKKYKITKLGDICYNPANLKFGVICLNNYGDGIFSPIYITFEVQPNSNSQYIGAYLNRWDFINKVRKYEEGTVYERMSVKPDDFLKYRINLPSLNEQEKIANLLSTIDKKIELEGQKLQNFKELKKGLMQQMFV